MHGNSSRTGQPQVRTIVFGPGELDARERKHLRGPRAGTVDGIQDRRGIRIRCGNTRTDRRVIVDEQGAVQRGGGARDPGGRVLVVVLHGGIERGGVSRQEATGGRDTEINIGHGVVARGGVDAEDVRSLSVDRSAGEE